MQFIHLSIPSFGNSIQHGANECMLKLCSEYVPRNNNPTELIGFNQFDIHMSTHSTCKCYRHELTSLDPICGTFLFIRQSYTRHMTVLNEIAHVVVNLKRINDQGSEVYQNRHHPKLG